MNREERRRAKQQAKIQDKNHVEFRKNEILEKIKPTTKAFDMKKFDDSFPHNRNKGKTCDMEFGQLMTKYLSMRPEPRFATWYGRPKKKKAPRLPSTEKGGHAENVEKKVVAAAAAKATAKVAAAAAKAAAAAASDKVEKAEKAVEAKTTPVEKKVEETKLNDEQYEELKRMFHQHIAVFEHEVDKTRRDHALHFMTKEQIENKNYVYNAIVIDDDNVKDGKKQSVPFWTRGEPVAVDDEEDDYVDAKLLDDYLTKKVFYKCNPAERKTFYIWGDVAQLANEMKHYDDKRLVIGNTLASIAASSNPNGKRIDRTVASQLVFEKFNMATIFNPTSKGAERTAIFKEDYKNHTRDKTGAEAKKKEN